MTKAEQAEMDALRRRVEQLQEMYETLRGERPEAVPGLELVNLVWSGQQAIPLGQYARVRVRFNHQREDDISFFFDSISNKLCVQGTHRIVLWPHAANTVMIEPEYVKRSYLDTRPG